MARKRLLLLLLATTVLVTAGCGVLKRNASEGDSQVAVAVEGPFASVVKPMIRKALERSIYTPQDERRFYTTFVTEDSLGPVSRWQNVLLVGALDSDDQISQRIQRMLSGEVLQGVRDGKFSVFRQKDVWARGQTVVVLVAPTRAKLVDWIENHGDELYNLFAEDRYARMKKNMYSTMEQTEMADSLQKAHGWKLRIPHDYSVVASEHSPYEFVRLRRFFPDRLITISWREGTADEVTVDSLVAWRNALGKAFADSQRVNTDMMQSRTVTLDGHEALEVHGLWETYGALGGGPFVAYLLYDNGYLYLLDGEVFAPDRAKEMYIRQLEVILQTFKP